MLEGRCGLRDDGSTGWLHVYLIFTVTIQNARPPGCTHITGPQENTQNDPSMTSCERSTGFRSISRAMRSASFRCRNSKPFCQVIADLFLTELYGAVVSTNALYRQHMQHPPSGRPPTYCRCKKRSTGITGGPNEWPRLRTTAWHVRFVGVDPRGS